MNFAVQSFFWVRTLSAFTFPSCCAQPFCRMRPLLSAAVFADLALYLAVGGLASVELSCSLSLSCFQHVWHRFLGCLSLLCGAFHALFLLLLSSSVVGSRSATSYLATTLRLSTALQSARGRVSACSGPCCESSSGSSVPTLALVESRQFSAQP